MSALQDDVPAMLKDLNLGELIRLERALALSAPADGIGTVDLPAVVDALRETPEGFARGTPERQANAYERTLYAPSAAVDETDGSRCQD